MYTNPIPERLFLASGEICGEKMNLNWGRGKKKKRKVKESDICGSILITSFWCALQQKSFRERKGG